MNIFIKIGLVALFSSTLAFSAQMSDDVKKDYFKSYDYEQMGKYNEAIKVLSPLYKKYPKGYTLNLRLGWLFYLKKRYTNAVKYYKRATLANMYALDPKLGMISVYLETQKFNEAEMVAQELIKIDFYNYYANLYMVQSLIAQNKLDIATKIINKMLALYPTDIKYLEQLAIVYQIQESKYLSKLYEDILILDPNNILVRTAQK